MTLRPITSQAINVTKIKKVYYVNLIASCRSFFPDLHLKVFISPTIPGRPSNVINWHSKKIAKLNFEMYLKTKQLDIKTLDADSALLYIEEFSCILHCFKIVYWYYLFFCFQANILFLVAKINVS